MYHLNTYILALMLALVPSVMDKNEFIKTSYRKLHEITGVDPKNWSQWFNGKHPPTLDSLRKVAERLEMPLPDLVEAFEERRKKTMGEE